MIRLPNYTPLIGAALLVGIAGSFPAIGLCDGQEIDFVRDVRPIFVEHCYACHGGIEQESGLRLDLKSAAFKGGDNHGPDIVAGDVDSSPLLGFVKSTDPEKRMPPDNAF